MTCGGCGCCRAGEVQIALMPAYLPQAALTIFVNCSDCAGAAAAVPDGHYRGFLDALVQITRQEGVRGLYKGLLPSLLLVRACFGGLVVYCEAENLILREQQLMVKRSREKG